jgi:hypothetical protein
LNRKTRSEWRERLPLDFGRESALRADDPALPRTAVMARRRAAGWSALVYPGVAGPIRSRARPHFPPPAVTPGWCSSFAEDVESEVVTAGSIIVIRFKRPVDIPSTSWPRRCPIMSDRRGAIRMASAIRLSLARRVTDQHHDRRRTGVRRLLPDSWTGPPPGLPTEVVRELAERARVAERELRLQRAVAEARKRPPTRVRASVQPTFVRFVFEMPDGVGVSSVLNDQKLKLLFNAVLTFDLADAKLAAPSNIASINQRVEGETSVVEITLIGDVDVHSFREDKNYIIDVAFQQAEKATVLPSPMSDASHARRQPLPRRSLRHPPRQRQQRHPRPRSPPWRLRHRGKPARSCRRRRRRSPGKPTSRSSPTRRRNRHPHPKHRCPSSCPRKL